MGLFEKEQGAGREAETGRRSGHTIIISLGSKSNYNVGDKSI